MASAVPEAPLVGRTALVQDLVSTLLARAKDGTGAVFLTGESGVGKTRLLHEIGSRLRAGGAAVLLSSHDLDFVGGWCGRGLLLGPGGRWKMLEGAEWDAWRRAPSLAFGG